MVLLSNFSVSALFVSRYLFSSYSISETLAAQAWKLAISAWSLIISDLSCSISSFFSLITLARRFNSLDSLLIWVDLLATSASNSEIVFSNSEILLDSAIL